MDRCESMDQFSKPSILFEGEPKTAKSEVRSTLYRSQDFKSNRLKNTLFISLIGERLNSSGGNKHFSRSQVGGGMCGGVIKHIFIQEDVP